MEPRNDETDSDGASKGRAPLLPGNDQAVTEQGSTNKQQQKQRLIRTLIVANNMID